mmetsp:Transcript_291/g.685  ORF Transcript_291/g.685 Transcript_291/m.685 type:complete len:158 (-) Transcript_291:476-949(-)
MQDIHAQIRAGSRCAAQRKSHIQGVFHFQVSERGHPRHFSVCLAALHPSDRNEDEWAAYFRTMPAEGWFAIPYSERSVSLSLKQHFGVSKIPRLVVLDPATGQPVVSQAKSIDYFSLDVSRKRVLRTYGSLLALKRAKAAEAALEDTMKGQHGSGYE